MTAAEKKDQAKEKQNLTLKMNQERPEYQLCS